MIDWIIVGIFAFCSLTALAGYLYTAVWPDIDERRRK